jgi:catechol 2,3-dioxygenase-like lactoylglutathione lyase family enzyme
MTTATLAAALKFHLGLNVADVDRAVAFYRTLFGIEPAKHFADYARFEVQDPPLVLTLNPSPRSAGGALNHVGLRVTSSDRLVAIQQRLEVAGIRTQREEGVECCYARQTKFWVSDPDRNLWEIYTLEEDLEHSGFGGSDADTAPQSVSPTDPVVWEHLLVFPVPERIPFADGAVDEIRLEGTFNADLAPGVTSRLIADALRVLRPGGRIAVHGLVSDRPFPGVPSLPGPAAVVRRIPVETQPLDELSAAGFTGLNYEKLGDIHCFQAGRVELREMRLTGIKPFLDDARAPHFVLYKGPFTQIATENNQIFPRGERVQVDAANWRLLRQPPFAEHFASFSAADSVSNP